MKHIEWNARYETEIDFIDNDHKILFSTMNKLLKLCEDEEKSEWVCREGVKFLKNHSLEHFEREEQYMQSIGYDKYEIHKRLHDDFKLKTLPALEAEMQEMNFSIQAIRHFLGVCIGWVVSHTVTEDLAIVGKASSKWKDIPHECERDAIEQTVVQLFQDIYHMKAKMISEQYSGEDFGNVLCNRFIYRNNENKEWEVILIYEEQLLLKIMSSILNMEYSKVDDMVVNVSRYISRQFLERFKENFPILSSYKLEKENLLTYEQMIESFEYEHPSYSVLFNTKEGYFSFCMMTADTIHEQDEPIINHKNAISAIDQYLTQEKKEWKEKKKKILIVDDSNFMRKNIINLLGNEYNVIEAASSVSAIQSIVLNKPDLLLLDYEMPVCDGRQMLEMIRSEQATSNIPVIFLTGKGDRESVKKVMALKPEGYLLKTMSEEEIKKVISDFFESRN